MSQTVRLDPPKQIKIRLGVKNPDKVLDDIVAKFADRPDAARKFSAMKKLDEAAKVQWLLSLPRRQEGKTEPLTGCAIVIVSVAIGIFTGYVCSVIADALTGHEEEVCEPQYEEGTEEQEVEVCDD